VDVVGYLSTDATPLGVLLIDHGLMLKTDGPTATLVQPLNSTPPALSSVAPTTELDYEMPTALPGGDDRVQAHLYVEPNAKPKQAATAPAPAPAGIASGDLVYETPNAGVPLALIEGVAALQGGAPLPAVVADYEYGAVAAAHAHNTYIDPNTQDSPTTTTNAAVNEYGPGPATTDNTGVYSLYTGSTAVQHDAYDMPTADAALDESNL
jgi:hypothetical protein